MLSSTESVEVLTIVVVPSIVKFPVIVVLPVKVISPLEPVNAKGVFVTPPSLIVNDKFLLFDV